MPFNLLPIQWPVYFLRTKPIFCVTMSRSVLSITTTRLNSVIRIHPNSCHTPFASTKSITSYERRLPLRIYPVIGNVRNASTATAVAPDLDEEAAEAAEGDTLDRRAAPVRETNVETRSDPADTPDFARQQTRVGMEGRRIKVSSLSPEAQERIRKQEAEWLEQQNLKREVKKEKRRVRREKEREMAKKEGIRNKKRIDNGIVEEKKPRGRDSRQPKTTKTPRGNDSKEMLETDERLAMLRDAARNAQQQEKDSLLARKAALASLDPTSAPPTPTEQPFSSPFFSQASTTNPRPPRRFERRLPHDAPSWQIQKQTLSSKFPVKEGGWNPRRKLSPDARIGIRDLHQSDPELYTTPVLAEHFRVSPEAIRRILRSKWMDNVAKKATAGDNDDGHVFDDPTRPLISNTSTSANDFLSIRQSQHKMQDLRERWARRHDRIWDQKSALGLMPKRVRETRVDDPAEGRERWEGEIRRRETLGRARGLDPLVD